MRTALTAALLLSLAPAALAHPGGYDRGYDRGRDRCACDVDDLLDAYLALFNDREADWTHVIAPDYVVESPYGTFDLAGWQGLTGAAWAAFPDIAWAEERVVVDGDRIALEYSFSGTFTNDFLAFVAQGQQVDGRGMEMHEIDERTCRITRTWNYSDAYGFFAQLQ